jgi:hypothetical protein
MILGNKTEKKNQARKEAKTNKQTKTDERLDNQEHLVTIPLGNYNLMKFLFPLA